MAISISNAANQFVRVLLSDAGKLAGGLSPEQWDETLAFFGNCCAYTGEPHTEAEPLHKDHAIPINQDHCGLDLFGNVVPAANEVNSKKGDKDYKEFVKAAGRLHVDVQPDAVQKIEKFMAEAQYQENASRLQGLRAYCRTQYDVMRALREANKAYLKMLYSSSGTDEARLGGKATMTARAEACIRDGLNDEQTLEIVKMEFPQLRTDIRGIQSIRSRMRRHDERVPLNKDLK